jgi:hypothetical protein
MIGPTKRQIEVLRLIAQHVQDRGFPPSLRELGRMMGVTWGNGVRDHLLALQRKGLIARDVSGRSRGITLLPTARPYLDGLHTRPSLRPVSIVHPIRCSQCDTESFAPDNPCFGCYLVQKRKRKYELRIPRKPRSMTRSFRLQDLPAGVSRLACRVPQCKADAICAGSNGCVLPFCRKHIEMLPFDLFDELVKMAPASPYDPGVAPATERLISSTLQAIAEWEETTAEPDEPSLYDMQYAEPTASVVPRGYVRWIAYDKQSPDGHSTIVMSETWIMARQLGSVALGLLIERVDAKMEQSA